MALRVDSYFDFLHYKLNEGTFLIDVSDTLIFKYY